MKKALVSLYHLKPIPKERREDFFTDTSFWGVDVIHLRHEEENTPRIYQPEDGDPTPIHNRVPFKAYFSIAQVGENGKVVSWGGDDEVKLAKLKEQHGDILAWMTFNKELTITKFETQSITRA